MLKILGVSTLDWQNYIKRFKKCERMNEDEGGGKKDRTLTDEQPWLVSFNRIG